MQSDGPNSAPAVRAAPHYVSMGATATLKLAAILDHVRTVLAIERAADEGRSPARPDIAAIRALIDDGTLLTAGGV